MDSFQIRNFKDFLLHFNQLSEKCFQRCVDNLNTRTLSPSEEQCVELCAKKFINVNHRILGVFVEAQAASNQKRMLEMEEQNSKVLASQEKLANNPEEIVNNSVETLPEPITSPTEVNTNT